MKEKEPRTARRKVTRRVGTIEEGSEALFQSDAGILAWLKGNVTRVEGAKVRRRRGGRIVLSAEFSWQMRSNWGGANKELHDSGPSRSYVRAYGKNIRNRQH